MICSTMRGTRQPAGRYVQRPAPSWRTSPARTSSRWLTASASAGGSLTVGRKYWEKRGIGAGDPIRGVANSSGSSQDRRRTPSERTRNMHHKRLTAVAAAALAVAVAPVAAQGQEQQATPPAKTAKPIGSVKRVGKTAGKLKVRYSCDSG